jgi:hypothetical protein
MSRDPGKLEGGDAAEKNRMRMKRKGGSLWGVLLLGAVPDQRRAGSRYQVSW